MALLREIKERLSDTEKVETTSKDKEVAKMGWGWDEGGLRDTQRQLERARGRNRLTEKEKSGYPVSEDKERRYGIGQWERYGGMWKD